MSQCRNNQIRPLIKGLKRLNESVLPVPSREPCLSGAIKMPSKAPHRALHSGLRMASAKCSGIIDLLWEDIKICKALDDTQSDKERFTGITSADSSLRR